MGRVSTGSWTSGEGRGGTYHSFHEADETPEGESVFFADGVDGRQQVGHALDVAVEAVGLEEARLAELAVPDLAVAAAELVVRHEDVLELLEVDVGADFGEGALGVRVRDVFTGEEGHLAVGAVDVFLDALALFLPPLAFFGVAAGFVLRHAVPPAGFEAHVFFATVAERAVALVGGAAPVEDT